jgi:D-alanyl-D-alanine endopeptidase (penicillin-binding protein 7)
MNTLRHPDALWQEYLMKSIKNLAALWVAAAFLIGLPAQYADAAQKRATAAKSAAKPLHKKGASKVSYRIAGKGERSATLRRASVVRVKAAPVPDFDASGNPLLRSAAVLVQDQNTGQVLYEKNSDAVVPIASITKLMTAMVTLDAKLGLNEVLAIDDDDVDQLRGTRSRLGVGTQLTREDLLRLALMSSENRAAAALGRHYPGGTAAFVAEMNFKAFQLGLTDTRFVDSTGLNAANVSSARDLVKLVAAAAHYPLIREFSTSTEHAVALNGRTVTFHNTNALVASSDWEIAVSKTGYLSEAGKCLVMQAWLGNKPTIIVLLDSSGRFTRLGDANRIKRWMESIPAAARTRSS